MRLQWTEVSVVKASITLASVPPRDLGGRLWPGRGGALAT